MKRRTPIFSLVLIPTLIVLVVGTLTAAPGEKRRSDIFLPGVFFDHEQPLLLLEWPFDTSVPIASMHGVDLSKISFDTDIPDWIDNNHLVTYDCVEVEFSTPSPGRQLAFYHDSRSKVEQLFGDKHGGLDLNFPERTPMISRWDTEIYTEGELNIVFLFNEGEITLKLGHIDYVSAGFERGRHYQVRDGDIVGYVKKENGYTTTHPDTGSQTYTEIHFEIALLKPGESVIRGDYNDSGTHYIVDGLVGPCNPNPPVRWASNLSALTWVNDGPPEFEWLTWNRGSTPVKFSKMSEEEIKAWLATQNERPWES